MALFELVLTDVGDVLKRAAEASAPRYDGPKETTRFIYYADYLTAGQSYTYEAKDLTGTTPDTVLHVLRQNADGTYTQVAANDDCPGVGLSSCVTFTATATTNLTLVMPTNANTFHTYGLALRQPLLVTTTSDSGPGSLRQAVLDAAALPGAPRAVPTPGHTGGHCSYLVGSVLVSGDALVTGHPVSGRVGPQLLPSVFNHDEARCRASLTALADVDAEILVPGHGEVWHAPIRELAAQAHC